MGKQTWLPGGFGAQHAGQHALLIIAATASAAEVQAARGGTSAAQ